MQFGWSEVKSCWTLEARGIAFEVAALIFEGETLEQIDGRHDYGEVRVKAIGVVGDDVLAVVYTDRGDVRWIISARKASRKERKLWQARSSE